MSNAFLLSYIKIGYPVLQLKQTILFPVKTDKRSSSLFTTLNKTRDLIKKRSTPCGNDSKFFIGLLEASAFF